MSKSVKEARKEGYVIIVEGETDCARLWREGFAALGIPGASNWKSEWVKYLDGINKVLIWQEPDEAGKTTSLILSSGQKKLDGNRPGRRRV